MSQFVSDCDFIYQYTGSDENVNGVFSDEATACGECSGNLNPDNNYYLGWNCDSAPQNSPYTVGYNSDCQNVYATLFYDKTNGDSKTVSSACQNCDANRNLASNYNYNNIGSCANEPEELNIGYNSDGHAWFFNTYANANDFSTPSLACNNPSFTVNDQVNVIKSKYGTNWKIIGQCINQDATITENFQLFDNKKNLFFYFLFAILIIILSIVIVKML
jgi:hypothetical protein